MLDELDALMERMLALPVNDLEDVPREPPQRPALAATLTVLEEPRESPSPSETVGQEELLNREYPAAESQADASSYQTSETIPPSSDDFESSLAPSSPGFASGPNYEWRGQAAETTGAETLPPLIRPRSTAVLVPYRKPRRTLAGWLLSPLVRFNLAFDRWMSRLGWAGGWARRPWGRLTLGLIGLGMMLGAIGWVLYDWSNWTR